MDFMLVCDGSSDGALVSHIRRLLIESGVSKPEGYYWTQGRYLADKIRNGMSRFGDVDLIFVHRDAESTEPEVRYREIESAVERASYRGPWVGLVPVRMTEAWLLLDVAAIRAAVRNPNGRTPLTLPMPHECEQRADPKTILETALIDASETRGRRRIRIRKEWPDLRRGLLESLPVGGPLEQLPSWSRFRQDTLNALQELAD